jgi:hypothetical protein
VGEERKCERCGDDEFRINGYCSCECESLHEREIVVRDLVQFIQRAMVYLPSIGQKQAKKLIDDCEWAAAHS